MGDPSCRLVHRAGVEIGLLEIGRHGLPDLGGHGGGRVVVGVNDFSSRGPSLNHVDPLVDQFLEVPLDQSLSVWSAPAAGTSPRNRQKTRNSLMSTISTLPPSRGSMGRTTSSMAFSIFF